MIAFLKGKIIDLNTQSTILETSGWIGYELMINEFIFSKISEGSEVSFFVYHSISDMRQTLFAFLDKKEREIFIELLKISWIGGRGALNLLNFWYEKLIFAIKNGDKSFFESVKWVGKKLAEKILIEMSDKDIVKAFIISSQESEEKTWKKENSTLPTEAIKSALCGMGYRESDVEKELKILPEGYETLEVIIPYIIKKLS